VIFPICREVIDATLTVTEVEIVDAMRMVAQADHWIVEGAAGVAVAGMFKSAAAYPRRKIAAVLCARNIALEKFLSAVGNAGGA
jgi:threonine dehydratase